MSGGYRVVVELPFSCKLLRQELCPIVTYYGAWDPVPCKVVIQLPYYCHATQVIESVNLPKVGQIVDSGQVVLLVKLKKGQCQPSRKGDLGFCEASRSPFGCVVHTSYRPCMLR